MTDDKLAEALGLMHDIRIDVAIIKTRLDQHVERQTERTQKRDEREGQIVKRVSALERWQWLAMGAASAAGGIAGKVVGLL